MLTGRRAFDGDDVADTLATVLKSEPDWNALAGRGAAAGSDAAAPLPREESAAADRRHRRRRCSCCATERRGEPIDATSSAAHRRAGTVATRGAGHRDRCRARCGRWPVRQSGSLTPAPRLAPRCARTIDNGRVDRIIAATAPTATSPSPPTVAQSSIAATTSCSYGRSNELEPTALAAWRRAGCSSRLTGSGSGSSTATRSRGWRSPADRP